MANNYSQFSEMFTFKTEEAAQRFVGLAGICTALQDGDIDPEDLEAKLDAYEALADEHKKMVNLWSSGPAQRDIGFF